MVGTHSTQTVALALAVLAATADAHSKMSLPKPTWVYPDGPNSPSGTIDPTSVLPLPSGMSYSTDPLSNTKAYWTAFKASSYTSLKELVSKPGNQVVNTDQYFGTASVECGYSWTNGTARDLPDTVQWDKLTTGHDGPCEVWCDDVLAFSDDNCAVNYPGDPAEFPYDKSKCEGASMLTSIWLALHSPPWQVFTNCAPLTGATSSGSPSTTTTTTTTTAAPTATTTAPASTTTAPASTTTAPATTSSDEYDDDSTAADYDDESSGSGAATTTTTAAPASTTAAPAATTSAPATTAATPSATEKCTASARRNRRARN